MLLNHTHSLVREPSTPGSLVCGVCIHMYLAKSGSASTPDTTIVSVAAFMCSMPWCVAAPSLTNAQLTGNSHGPLLSAGPLSKPVWVTVTAIVLAAASYLVV